MVGRRTSAISSTAAPFLSSAGAAASRTCVPMGETTTTTGGGGGTPSPAGDAVTLAAAGTPHGGLPPLAGPDARPSSAGPKRLPSSHVQSPGTKAAEVFSTEAVTLTGSSGGAAGVRAPSPLRVGGGGGEHPAGGGAEGSVSQESVHGSSASVTAGGGMGLAERRWHGRTRQEVG